MQSTLPERYSPIDYVAHPPSLWGPGHQILNLLSPAQWRVWEAVLPFQDKRDDPGQGEMVTYFAAVLSDRAGLSPADKDVAILAAILHDTGYAKIPEVDALFRRLGRDCTQRSDMALQKSAKAELLEIRYVHQNNSVAITKEQIPDHPRLAEIIAIIGDHDTRTNPPTPTGQFMWDSDVQWRFTIPGVTAGLIQCTEDKKMSEGYLNNLLTQLKREKGCFFVPGSLEIARYEFVRTMNVVLETASPFWNEIERARREWN